MNRSDWIALLAAVGTLLGLIPAYHQFIQSRKPKKSPKKKDSGQPSEQNTSGPVVEAPREIGAWEKAFVCTSIGVLIFVVELILYSWIARIFGVKFEFVAMPLNWKVGFVALFVVPVFLLHLAFLHIVSTMTD